jgi:hypothetical protein
MGVIYDSVMRRLDDRFPAARRSLKGREAKFAYLVIAPLSKRYRRTWDLTVGSKPFLTTSRCPAPGQVLLPFRGKGPAGFPRSAGLVSPGAHGAVRRVAEVSRTRFSISGMQSSGGRSSSSPPPSYSSMPCSVEVCGVYKGVHTWPTTSFVLLADRFFTFASLFLVIYEPASASGN